MSDKKILRQIAKKMKVFKSPMDRTDRKSSFAELYAGIDRQANIVVQDAVKRRALSKTWKPWGWMLTKQEKAWATLELVAEREEGADREKGLEL